MSTLGMFSTQNYAPNQLDKSYESRLISKYPGNPAILTSLSAKMKSGSIMSHRHHWTGESMVFARGTITAPAAAATTSGQAMVLSVNDATDFVPGAVLLNLQTDEQMYVESIIDGTTILVRRAFGSTPGRALLAGMEIWQIGTAYEEGSLRPLAKSYSHSEFDNITQIFRNSWAVSGTVEAENQLTGGKVSVKNKKQAAFFHAIDREMAILWGERHSSMGKGQALRKTDGIISQIRKYAPQNIRYAASTTSFKQFSRMINGTLDISTDMTNDNDRLLFMGNQAYEVINDMGRMQGVVEMPMEQTSFGMNFKKFSTTQGNFTIMKHPLFNLNPTWSSMVLVLDPSALETMYLRKTIHTTFNAKVNNDSDITTEEGMDAMGGTFLTEMLVANLVPESGGVVYGLCQATRDIFIDSPTTFAACFAISNPCSAGTVAPSATIVLTITGSKPSIAVAVAGPGGTTFNITIDVDGNGTTTRTMPATPGSYAFAIAASGSDFANVAWSSPVVQACVAACDPVMIESNSPDISAATVVPTPTILEFARTNNDIQEGATTDLS